MSNAKPELRYSFGKNWAEYIEKKFGDEVIEQSRAHLASFLRLDSLSGLTFLDMGCGSGLHSFVAHRMGADRIVSFDYDADSVATTKRLREYLGNPANWSVAQGSVLDRDFMEKLPKADIVYSWGVFHHTGDMWTAIRDAAKSMKPDGVYYIALYSADNYVDPPPQYWITLKRKYNLSRPIGKWIMEWQYVLRFVIMPELKVGRNPLELIANYATKGRGMAFWTDVKDWLGGYPMEFASFQETQNFCKEELGLDLVNVKTGEGNTEYLLCYLECNSRWQSIVEERKLMPLARPFVSQGGTSYVSVIPDLEAQADSPNAPRRSRLMLYEDGRMLGLAHSLHSHVVLYGRGRFSHWRSDILFSSTDNSGPNVNGRVYEYCEKFLR